MADNVEQKTFRERLDTALSLESGRGREIQNRTPTVAKDLPSTIGGLASRQIEEREGGRFDEAIQHEDDNKLPGDQTGAYVQFEP